ncbi:hypothetical protein [Weissella viridescens]|uniref:hypothetical protein n=1 Tax=Weissella viridescens TaxID=1629 RepID=UPI00352774BF
MDDKTSTDDVEKEVDDANKQGDKNLEDAKDEAKQEIDKNPNLSDKKKRKKSRRKSMTRLQRMTLKRKLTMPTSKVTRT